MAATYEKFQPSPSPKSETDIPKTLSSQASPSVETPISEQPRDHGARAADAVDEVADDEDEPVHADDVRG